MKQNTIFLRFYEELNNYLPVRRRKVWFEYRFSDKPTIKDIVELIGVPYSEIDLILVNGKSVNFSFKVKNNDKVSVYPVFEAFDISTVSRLRTKPLREPNFIVEANLGKLAKYLRLFGFDVYYQNTNGNNSSVDSLTKKNTPIVLTRGKNIFKKKLITHGYQVKSNDPKKQIEEVINKFDLFSRIKPLIFCLQCNEKIVPIEKNKIINKLPSKIPQYFNEFFICPTCKKIYWRGIHYQTMLAFVRQIKKNCR